MKRALTVIVGIAVLALASDAAAQDVCTKYYGKGYCTDYVEQRVGKRQRGDAGKWSCNVAMVDVRVGDVAVFKGNNHVAVVEQVDWTTRRVRVSEWNFGRVDRSDPEKVSCTITDKFGVRTERTIKIASASCYWRP